ncbi:RecQ family ATP-dependent DNA helicase [Enorma sp.]|uniref:RecQ family ATP-dependent DNA helicase n=1 Tax=Enorma sp. TaxID=1920692 RepID=UPI0025BE405D|nr:RecQ family ATP-dependent DNA helicase [Enorma sp.]
MADAVYTDLEGGSLSALITQLKEKGLISSDASIDAIARKFFQKFRDAGLLEYQTFERTGRRCTVPTEAGIARGIERHDTSLYAYPWFSGAGIQLVLEALDSAGMLTVPLKRDDKPGEQAQTAVPTPRPGDPYPDRTPQEIDTEDKDAWCRKGEELERDFVARIVPLTGRDVRINPEKATNPYAIDLHDYDNDRPADLKSFMTPFFTCARYTQDEAGRPLARRLDPRLTITFDAKDYRRYCELYPECDIYLYVHWEQLAYRDVEIEPLEGVWVARFADMRAKIEERALVHHYYLRRQGDPHNANDCYLFDLRDPIFTKLIERAPGAEEPAVACAPVASAEEDCARVEEPTQDVPSPERDAAARQATALLRDAYGEGAEFRAGQLEAIVDAATGERVLVVQKTGWGKSLVYFMATKILRAQGAGPTLIISPLLALMENQIESAKRLGLNVATINSGNKDDWEEIFSHLGSHDALIVSPERLSNDGFMKQLAGVRGIKLFVVDEAHCISDWGHDFRPDYQRVSRFLQNLPEDAAILGTTATANNRVIKDIRSQLGHNLSVVRGDLIREELAIQVNPEQTREERLAWLAQTLGVGGGLVQGQGLIYCLTQRDCEHVAEYLQQHGVSARAYHSGLDQEVSDRALADYEAGDVRVLCCTIKLGMGYDKADIRFVINFQLPENLISYYQQIGRAGRDGKRAYAVLLHGPEDEGILKSFIDSAFAEPDLLEKIIDRCSSGATQREVMASVNATAGKVKEALKYLQVHGYLYQEKRKNQRGSMVTMFCVNEGASFDAQAERERQAELCATRQDELASFREFLRTDGCLMKYIADELDAPDAKDHCGICANCTGEPLFPVEVDKVLVDEAISFEKNRHGFVKPRKQWPDGTRIALEEQCGRGWILSDNYFSLLGQLAATGKYRDGRFSDELLMESARYLRSATAGVGIDAVVAVPSLRRPTLVPDFAERLAHALKVPFVDGAVRKIAEGVAQKTLNSSALQVKNIHDTIEVAKPGRIAGKTVLLVDDMVDSGWTFAVIASELVRAGAKAVYPYALVKTGKGD